MVAIQDSKDVAADVFTTRHSTSDRSTPCSGYTYFRNVYDLSFSVTVRLSRLLHLEHLVTELQQIVVRIWRYQL
jgi:hypothetical protein